MSISLYEFADRLNKIMPAIITESARRYSSGFYKVKVSLPQLFILNFLNEADETKMTDLAHFTKVTTAAMTGVIDRLVKYNYVSRVFDPNDRRVIRVKITAKGGELIKKINQQKRQMVINVFSKISETEREQYLKILTRIHDILTKETEE